MKSLHLVLAAVLLLASPTLKADLLIDTSGTDGGNASNGHDGYSTGSDGSNAGKSTSGGDAGRIDIRVRDNGDGEVAISGTHDRTFRVGSGGQIVLRAHGGKGGNGAKGGDGARGHRGSDGHNATRYSSGTDGGRGGTGGDGGNGSSGSDGGNGGTIVVTVKEKDMRLLYLFATPDVRAGQGGARGQNGRGGPGGSGGSGGSSYSWTVDYQSTCSSTCPDTCHGTKTVRGGNGTSTTVDYDYPCSKSCQVSCTKTRTESNPGGSDGPTGYSGRDGNASLYDGANGRDGNYKFVVEYNDGRVESYTSPFEPVISSFQLATDFNDTFIQPGEKMKISEVTITNRGGMPTPTLTPLRVRPDSDQGSISTDASLDLKTSIPAGGSLTVKGEMATELFRSFLTINTPEAGKHMGGLQKNLSIGVSTEIVGIRRFGPRLTAAHPMTVKFPVSISRVLGKRSIGQGDDYLFRWSVNNASNKELGSASQGHRNVRFVSSFSFNSGKNDGTFFLNGRDETEKGIQNVNTVAGRNSRGAAQESALLWAKLGFTNNAKLLDEGTLKIVVEIEDPYIKGKWIQADVAYFPVKVGNSFNKTSNADVLIVSSPQTTATELDAWKALVLSSGRNFDVWDVGIMGPLDIGNKSLAQAYAGGSIIILNDLIKQPGDEFVPVDAMFKLAPSDFIPLAKENRIGIFVFDRTGSYKSRAGGFGSLAGRGLDSPMLVATKVSQENFKDAGYIKNHDNRVSLAMTLTFNRKLEEFYKLAKSAEASDDAIETAKAYIDAIMSDLAMEQISVREKDSASKSDFVLLSRLVEHGLIDPIDGSNDQARNNPFAKLVLDIMGRIWFLSDAEARWFDKPSKYTNQLVEALMLRSFKAEDGWFKSKNAKTAYKKVMDAIESRQKELNKDMDALVDLFVKNDKSRFFKFPRRWHGDYKRQAAYSAILRPVFDRTYTHKMELFQDVLEKERQALPAFN